MEVSRDFFALQIHTTFVAGELLLFHRKKLALIFP